ncbi:putative endopeptidase [Apibacter mensalis]|uniref:Putative endopeptidase n=1 Tax=Apibacter mensalis TaxID=1586267 RepID=A0A0X3AMY7_9FLAO|nr:M13 family metallopeptidase [Apibacter mensalis]CVK15716.1 putative endopeptidase [Apibacter mensalis]
MKRFILFITTALIPFTGTYAQKHGINEQYMDKKVRPQDDFYNYVNGNWMKNTQIPSDRSRWGSFDQLREFTDSISLTILKKSINQKYLKGSEQQKIKDLYNSFMNMDARNKQGITPIYPYLTKVDQVKNISDLQKLLIEFTPLGMNPFYEYSVQSDLNNSNKNAVYLNDVTLGLGRDYYQKNDEKSKKTLQDYTNYLSKLFKVIGYKQPDKTASDIVAFEKQLASNLLTVEQIRNAQLQNNPYSFTSLSNLSKNINLTDYFLKLGVQVDTVIIPEKKYFENLDKNLTAQNISLLKDYIKISIVRNAANSLTKELDDIHFDFYGKTLSGQLEQRSMEKRALTSINSLVGEAFGKLYVAEVFPEEAKRNAKELIEYLKKSFAIHINNLKWMSQPTKQKALDKLSKFMVKIGYPDKWKDYSNLEIKSIEEGGSYFQNQLNAVVFNYQRNKNKIDKPVDKTEWLMSPQTVNAYYNPSYNEIVFPAAILQPPFYNYTADAAVNFGGIGAVIGHEISHGFDDSGSQFDGDGNLKDWWTPMDKEKFEAATQALEKQFNAYEPVLGLHINGKLTLGENIADLGGVAIAYDALQLYLKDKGNPGKIDNYTPEQRYFLSWATIWRTKNKDEALINQIKTDPHAPGYYRAMAPLENVEGFYKAFNVQKGDKMFKPKKERIIIW